MKNRSTTDATTVASAIIAPTSTSVLSPLLPMPPVFTLSVPNVSLQSVLPGLLGRRVCCNCVRSWCEQADSYSPSLSTGGGVEWL